jgi:hypothetical protein
MKPISRPRLLVLALLTGVLVLGGCQTTPPTPPTGARPEVEPPTPEAATQAEAAGEYVVAADEYRRLAAAAMPPQRQHFQLKAVEAWLKAGQLREARQQMTSIDVAGLDVGFLGRKNILQAQIASAEGLHDQAIAFLNKAEKARHLDPTLLAELHRVRAQAQLALGRSVEAVRDYIGRERYIVGQEAIVDNQRQLWHALETADRPTLTAALTRNPELVLAGWLALGLAALDHPPASGRFAAAANDWRRVYPQHPALDAWLRTLAGPTPGLIGRVEQIALLLPLSSDYTQAAQAVQAGFMAMHAADPDVSKPRVQVYDIGADPAQAPAFYAQAVQAGANLVIGPLGLEATDQVVKNATLAVPTVLLSHTEATIDAPAHHVFQFGLPPEQEARQAAERMYLDGRRRAAVLFPANPFGQRMHEAFATHFARLGGVITAAQPYALGENEYSAPVKQLMGIDQSEARRQALEARLHTRLKFEPRPRADIDAIFLAADPRHGRLIKPQLNYHRAHDVPVYATSHIFAGKGDAARDVDLDGIMFGDMPWMLVGDGRVQTLRASLQAGWPYAHSPLDRLYALGMDAYAVIPQLNRISAQNAVRYEGVTSGLSVEMDGRLHRQLLWARFKQGLPRLLDTFLNYKGQFEPQDGKGTANSARP